MICIETSRCIYTTCKDIQKHFNQLHKCNIYYTSVTNTTKNINTIDEPNVPRLQQWPGLFFGTVYT